MITQNRHKMQEVVCVMFLFLREVIVCVEYLNRMFFFKDYLIFMTFALVSSLDLKNPKSFKAHSNVLKIPYS